VDDLKPGDIARRLGLSPEVVRTRKSRALKHLTEHVRRALGG
jgi:DNA-directed RNA polymerase specialized sigma24 family protein